MIGLALLCGLLPASAWAAATGRVVDPDGKPIAGIEVCNILHEVAIDCIKTDAQGYYRIAKPSGVDVFIRGSGYVPRRAAAVESSTPIVLKRAASLLIHVVDADTGQPVPSGKVILNYTSGLQIGKEAPFNRAGVQISSLRPGAILARCEAPGYAPAGPDTVILGEGEQKAITLAMKRRTGAAQK